LTLSPLVKIHLTSGLNFCKLRTTFQIYKWFPYLNPEAMKKQVLCISLILYVTSLCSAQQTLSTAGGEAAGTGGTLSYTIGQLAYTSITQSEGTVSQGVQQPFEIFMISSVKDKYGIELELSAYPNPVKEFLILKVVNYQSVKLIYHLYDVNGKLIENKEIVGAETNIQMDMLSPSVYLLKVINNDEEVKTFTIIKK
jgi:hypothetical protein